jgi:tetratricopeptide (TPR) repeat protein
MNKTYLWVSVLAVLLAFAGGFMLANAINRGEMNALKAENERLKNSARTGSDQELSPEEIRAKIDEADRNPTNFNFQKGLGIGLYRYATIKQDPELLPDAERLLKRAYELNPKDLEVLVFYGNTVFDIGYARKDNGKFEEARKLYTEALAQKPKDVDVQTDFGLTYFYENPPRDDKAAAELEKALAIKPDHERSLQYLAQIYARQSNSELLKKYLEELKKVNPQNPVIAQLESQTANPANQ